jgi:hypothetical protein
VTTETDFGVCIPVTAAGGGGAAGALAPDAPRPQPDIELNATAPNSAHATAFFMLDLPAGLMERAPIVFRVDGRITGYRPQRGDLKVIEIAEREITNGDGILDTRLPEA